MRRTLLSGTRIWLQRNFEQPLHQLKRLSECRRNNLQLAWRPQPVRRQRNLHLWPLHPTVARLSLKDLWSREEGKLSASNRLSDSTNVYVLSKVKQILQKKITLKNKELLVYHNFNEHLSVCYPNVLIYTRFLVCVGIHFIFILVSYADF